MQNLVNIQADDMGNVIRQSDPKSEYGFIRLTQSKPVISPTGWFSPKNLSALILGKVEELKSGGFTANQKLSGNIVIVEQLEPFNTNDPERDYKYAGDTGIVCCVDGQPIYRKTFFVADATAEDVLIAHNNGQDIKDANSSETNNAADVKVSAAEAFGFEDPEKESDDNTEIVAEEVVEEEVLEEETFEL